MELPNSLLTGKPTKPLFSLGKIYMSDFIKLGEEPPTKAIELSLSIDEETGLVQLDRTLEPEDMWGNKYWYKSGTNTFMTQALENVVKDTSSWLKEKSGIWCDIASNDGTLLSFVPKKDFVRIGIDPSAFPESERHADIIVKDYFSIQAFAKASPNNQADVITGCAFFYDLVNVVDFVLDVKAALKDTGLFVLQLSYTPLMLIQKELGNICHEHAAYYTFKSLEKCLELGGFKILDLELNDVNGGSIRVYCHKSETDPNIFGTQARRDIAMVKKDALRAFEFVNRYNEAETYIKFFTAMLEERKTIVSFLNKCKEEGKTVAGYGASTKANTVLQWMGIGPDLIPKIAERQGRKVGLVCLGSNIPVCSEEEVRSEQPDYLVVLPWHFISEFKERELEYLKNGGTLVTFSPKFELHQLN